ncbi:MAG: hypothetical protein J7L66_04260, partial [Anaerolineaceae bacterium]|nr:hypothetical protein [Anaerolineaceae bacterium]
YKGGEKPMDFSYFNALVKSVVYPPYDPWYAGGYINYYYWGFLIAAIPTKLMAIVPSIAYNLILPSFFSFSAMAVFSIGSNLYQFARLKAKGDQTKKIGRKYIAGFIAIIFFLILGNLGTVKMIIQGFQRLGGIENAGSGNEGLAPIYSLFEGVKVFLKGERFNYYPGDWYWIPSRAIPGEPITEFPYFTFLYGDPHAHLFALPITLISLCWTISLIKEKMKYKRKWELILKVLLGGVIIGSLYPTNTWDYPIFVFVACIGIIFTYIKYGDPPRDLLPNIDLKLKRVFISLLGAIGFGILSYVLYSPFSKWYGLGYSSLRLWSGEKTPIQSYITHWGFFLFCIYSWLIDEAIKWMKRTPISAINKFYPFRYSILTGLVLIIAIWIFLFIQQIIISIFVMPALLMIILLVLRRKVSDSERIILFFTAIGLGLTILVETIVLSGDVGRMNTVFKFYLQAWTFLSISSAWYLYSFIKNSEAHLKSNIRSAWRFMFILIAISVALYPLFASVDKINDRISKEVPLTLDGMDYMRYSVLPEKDTVMDLNEDYKLIRWMQDNIKGTPTIIEANTPEYRWGTRITIYTGLPGVIGWNWHQRQQRAINPSDWVFNRVKDVDLFYTSPYLSDAAAIIEKYNIELIVIGQLENAIYPAEGIQKFLRDTNGIFKIIYSNENTYLLRVVN